MIAVIVGVSLLGSGVLFLVDKQNSVREVTRLRRNSYGQGSVTQELEVQREGKRQKEAVTIEVGERQYTEEELESVFERAVSELEQVVLADNETLENIRSDLNLVTELSDEPITVEWEIDRYDLINVYGELNQENLRKEADGVLVELKAYLRYTEDETRQMMHIINVKLYPAKVSKAEKEKTEIQDAIAKTDGESATEEYLSLPAEVSGDKVEYYRPFDNRSAIFLFLGILFSILLFLLEQQNKKEDEKKKQEQMMRDYPEIISKINLLLGAGMTVKNVWKKIVEDYERQKEMLGIRFAYEEMVTTYHEMQSGIVEAECYEHFGKRCKLRPYRKLGALLSQNLRKGTKGLTALLSVEALQAYEERKMRTKRLGEEAGTKLLVPMFLMLAVVLVIVIVPAFLSIQI